MIEKGDFIRHMNFHLDYITLGASTPVSSRIKYLIRDNISTFMKHNPTHTKIEKQTYVDNIVFKCYNWKLFLLTPLLLMEI